MLCGIRTQVDTLQYFLKQDKVTGVKLISIACTKLHVESTTERNQYVDPVERSRIKNIQDFPKLVGRTHIVHNFFPSKKTVYFFKKKGTGLQTTR